MQTIRVSRATRIVAAVLAAMAATVAIGLSVQAASSPAPVEWHAELDTSPG